MSSGAGYFHEREVRQFLAEAKKARPEYYRALVRRTPIAASNEERRRKGRHHAISLEGLQAGWERF
jgi:hypothetical protein